MASPHAMASREEWKTHSARSGHKMTRVPGMSCHVVRPQRTFAMPWCGRSGRGRRRPSVQPPRGSSPRTGSSTPADHRQLLARAAMWCQRVHRAAHRAAPRASGRAVETQATLWSYCRWFLSLRPVLGRWLAPSSKSLSGIALYCSRESTKPSVACTVCGPCTGANAVLGVRRRRTHMDMDGTAPSITRTADEGRQRAPLMSAADEGRR